MRENIVIEGKLRQFAGECCDDRSSLELLLFLGRHPHVWFSQLAVIHALGVRKVDIVEAIHDLTDKGLVVTRTGESGLCLYALAEDSPSRDLVLELAALDCWQYRSLTCKCMPLEV